MLNLIGLATRARKVTTGTNITIDGVRTNRVKLVFLANDASDNTKKLVNDKCKTYNVLVNEEYSSEELSNSVGKTNIMVVGVIDEGFSRSMLARKRK